MWKVKVSVAAAVTGALDTQTGRVAPADFQPISGTSEICRRAQSQEQLRYGAEQKTQA